MAVVAVVLASSPAAAQGGSSDPRAERDRVRAERAGVATEVDALQADEAQVLGALQALDDNLRGQQAAYGDAQRAAVQAEADAEAARQAEAAKAAEIEALRTKVAELAVEAYVNPPSQDVLSTFEAESAGDAVRKRTLLDLRAGRDRDLLDELAGARQALEGLREQAEAADAAARSHRAEMGQRLQEVEAAQAQQAAFAAQVEARLDAKLAESASLAATDAQLSQQIAAQEAEVAARLKREADARSRQASSGGGASSTYRGYSGAASIPVATVRGITVAASVASQTEAMLSAAAAAGYPLSGTGYRDSSNQIALRRQNCGTSDYAVYQMSPSACSPATARPGASKHEQGLAIDFQGMRYGDGAFNWLQANAGSYGYVNSVPGEPWHWSVGGG